jgi:hypothetical protein
MAHRAPADVAPHARQIGISAGITEIMREDYPNLSRDRSFAFSASVMRSRAGACV